MLTSTSFPKNVLWNECFGTVPVLGHLRFLQHLSAHHHINQHAKSSLTGSLAFAMTNMPLNCLTDSYIALVPRGFHQVFVERLKREIQHGGYACNNIHFVGEREDPPAQEQYRQHLKKLLSNRKKQHSENIGTVRDTFMNQDVSVGYNSCGETVWCIPGTACSIWVYFSTNAPADFCHDHLRFIGPLMACVQTWENIDLHQDLSLEQATTLLQQLDLEPTKLEAALNLWLSHVEQSWPLSKEELNTFKLKMNSANDSSVLSYRLSCMRSAFQEIFLYSRAVYKGSCRLRDTERLWMEGGPGEL